LADDSESFIYGGKYGVGVALKNGGTPKPLKRFWSEEEEKDGKTKKMRANDGAVDSKGRFWVSAVCDPEVTSFAPEGDFATSP
jgi:sugar lactone lactonase YvrE